MRAIIQNRHGERLDHVFVPGHDADGPVVVIAHGLTSHKDRPWLIALADTLAAAGIASLRFSFAGNGASEGRFVDATFSKEVDDLGSVIDALGGRRAICAGHSMGAAVALLRTTRDERISALVSLAGMFDVASFMHRHARDLVPGRDVMFGKPQCPLTQAFLDDALRAGSALPNAAAHIDVPWLLVHGTDDELVPIDDARAARRASGGDAELVELAAADHRFTGRERAMADAVVAWLARVA